MGGGVPLLYFGRKNSSLLRLGRCRPDGKVILQACTNGSSEFMSNIAMSLVSMLYNLQLLHFAGEDGVAAYGVMMYVSMIFSAAFIGYSIGAAPIVSFHFGARNHGELQSLLRKSLRMIGLFGAAMVLSSQALALPLSKIFVGYDPDLMHMTASGFRIFGLSFLFMGYAIYASGFFTALSDGLTSALIAFLRTMVFQVAAVLLLPKLWELTGHMDVHCGSRVYGRGALGHLPAAKAEKVFLLKAKHRRRPKRRVCGGAAFENRFTARRRSRPYRQQPASPANRWWAPAHR